MGTVILLDRQTMGYKLSNHSLGCLVAIQEKLKKSS